MSRSTLVALAAAASLFACGAATAQTATTTAKAAAHKPAAKHTAKAAEPTLAPASPEQMAAAERAQLGDYHCEFDQTLNVSANAKAPGYVDVKFKKATYVMKPVVSSTGAIRLEDVTGRTLMVQIATKSMLLDTKLGQRLVDNCQTPDQLKAATAMAPSS